MHFEKDRLYIQSMDKSHICLANIEIKSKWFSEYDCTDNIKLSFDSTHFAILMNYSLKHNTIELKFENEVNPDKLYVNLLNGKENKDSFDHFFELNLIEVEEDSLGIPDVEYDVDFTIESKKLTELLSELNTIGQDLNIICNQEKLELNASGDSSKLKVNIPIDDLNEFSITEGEELNLSFSLNHLSKMCCSNKLGTTVELSLRDSYPMSLKYNLGDDSKVVFFIAPKIQD
jgi:proliferating cell nuclear antigen